MRIPPSARPSLAAASNGLPCRHGPSPPHLPDAPPLFAQCGHIIMIRPHRPVARTLPARPRAASFMASRRRAAACRGVSVTNVPALPAPRCLIEAVVASAWAGVARAARSAFLEEKSIPSQGDRLPARRSVPAPSGNPHHSHHAQWPRQDGPMAAIRHLEIMRMPIRRGSTAIEGPSTTIAPHFACKDSAPVQSMATGQGPG